MNEGTIASSRPLRALVMLLLLWAGGRATYEFAPPIGAIQQSASVIARPVTVNKQPATPYAELHREVSEPQPPTSTGFVRPQRVVSAAKRSRNPSPVSVQPNESVATPAPTALIADAAQPAALYVGGQSQPGTRRKLSLSSWLLVRDGTTGIAPAGTLGGAQVGVRANFAVTRSIAATARVSAPLRGPGAEASVGAALRRGPLTLLLERRIALERGGRNDFSATLAGGVDTVRLPKRFMLDAYGQAGIVGSDGFADGAVRIERRIGMRGKAEIALGAGLWGGAQPGIARVDAGPQLVVRMPIAGGNLRASGEWRQRIAGKAQPASGPALTLGMDF